MIEQLATTPRPLPKFEEYFYKTDKSFYVAADAWANDRRVLIPLREETFETQIIPAVIAAVSNFETDIMSDRFDNLASHFKRAATIICWSQGNPDIQDEKVAKVHEKLIAKGVDPNSISPPLIGEAKTEHISKILAKAESMARSRAKEKKERISLTVIEDKISNMMKFMHGYISEADPDNNIPRIDEDSLDKEDFDFDKCLNDWTKAINRYSKHFNGCNFVYTPPDKPLGEQIGTHISSLRNKRVRAWIKASNEAIKEARAKDSRIPTVFARTIYQHFPDQFFHIDDPSTDLNQIITPNSIIVADVDGPLVSQQKVLATREAALQSAFRNILERYYRVLFLVGLNDVANYFLYPTTQPGIVYSKNEKPANGPTEYALGIGSEYEKGYQYGKSHAIFWKDRIPGGFKISFHRGSKLGELDFSGSFDLNLEQYRQALESIGYKFPARA